MLYERGVNGAAALREAVELSAFGRELTVVTLAPQAPPQRCCGPGPSTVNCAAREEAQLELQEAREILGQAASHTTFKALIERRDPPPDVWIAEHDFDIVLLPAHRLSVRGGRVARKLRRAATAEIRVVG